MDFLKVTFWEIGLFCGSGFRTFLGSNNLAALAPLCLYFS